MKWLNKKLREWNTMQIKKLTLFFSCFLFISVRADDAPIRAWCDTGKPHPIDVELELTLKMEDATTVAIRNAQSIAHEKWMNLENKIYQTAKKELSKENAVILKKLQTEWKKMMDLDAELMFSTAYSLGLAGTIMPVIVSERSLDLRRLHACMLKKFLDEF